MQMIPDSRLYANQYRRVFCADCYVESTNMETNVVNMFFSFHAFLCVLCCPPLFVVVNCDNKRLVE
jgi:hypothetical protein